MAGPSVGVIVHNGSGMARLKTAVRSVLSQTVPPTQVIVICSDLSSAEIQFWRLFAESDHRFSLLEADPETSITLAINDAIGALKSDLVAFLAGDDAWSPVKLATQAGLLCSGSLPWSASSALLVEGKWRAVRAMRVPNMESLPAYVATNCWPIGRSTIVAQRSALREVGGFDSGAGNLADWDLWLSFALQYGSPVVADDALSVLRVFPKVASSDRNAPLSDYSYVMDKHAVSASRLGLTFQPWRVGVPAPACDRASRDRTHYRPSWFTDSTAVRWWATCLKAGSSMESWIARRAVPDSWQCVAEGWLTQLMKMEVREEESS